MAAPIKRGDDSPQIQSKTYSYDWSRGGTYVENWKGISYDKMTAKFNGIVYTAARSQMRQVNGVAEATFEWSAFPGSGGGGTSAKELTQDRWEIPEPKTEKPLVSHPKLYDIFSTIAAGTVQGSSDGTIASMMAQFQRGIASNAPGADMTGTTPTSSFLIKGWISDVNFPGLARLSSDELQFLLRQYQKCLNGQTHYQDSTYAVRHTTNAPAYWSANIADNNVNRVYTNSQLLSELQSTSLWIYPLPGRMAYKLTAAYNAFYNTFSTTARSRPGYQIGWLKSPFGESFTGKNRVEIQGGYVLDQWPNDLYPAAT